MAVTINFESSPQVLTFDLVWSVVSELYPNCPSDQIDTAISMIGNADFGGIKEEQLVQQLQERTKLPKKTIRAELAIQKLNQGAVSTDPGYNVAITVRDKYFDGGTRLVRSPDDNFLEFNGTHWTEIDSATVKYLILREANAILHTVSERNLTTLKNNAYSCLKDILGVDKAILAQNENPLPVINVRNGELWIDENGDVELRPHSPSSRMTYCLPISYDPNATCPKFSQTLLQIFENSSSPAALSRHFEEFFGYLIQPERNIPSFFMLIGQGANGKTKLLETVQRFLGTDAVMADSISKFGQDRFNLAYLRGKLAFIDDDITEGTRLDDGLIKKISEKKTLSARRAHGRKKVNFVCRALPIMAGNSLPRTIDISHGMLRRAQVIPFDRVFKQKEQDLTLFPSIWDSEMPGVLNKALSGLKRLRDRGNQFDPPADCLNARDEFFKHANPLVAFLDDQCEEAPEEKLRLMDLRNSLKHWAAEQGITKPASADNTLKRKLVSLGYKVTKINGYFRVWGLKLK